MKQHVHPPGQMPESVVERFRKKLGPFVAAAEAAHMAIAFTDGTRPDNPILFANDAFLTLTGYSREEVLERPTRELLGDLTDRATLKSIAAALGEQRGGSWELQCRRADGSEFLAAVYMSPMARTAGAKAPYVLAIVELGAPIERLLDQRNEFQAMYEEAPGFIAMTEGPLHRFTFANAAYRRFVCREHLVGGTVTELMPELTDQGFVTILDEVYRTGLAYVGRSKPIAIFDCAAGEMRHRWCDFVYQAVRDAKGRVTGLFCEGYDVTEQHKTADTLAALQTELIHVSRVNAMGTMATTLAHELNQPLSAIANYIAGARTLLQSEAFDQTSALAALEGIGEASQRAADIIRNLRDLIRRRDPARTSFGLKDAVAECIRLSRATASPAIRLKETVPDDTMICGDRVQIQQVIINLVRNACEAMAETPAPEVSIHVRDEGDSLVICVCDNGPGVPPEVARNIFRWTGSTKEGGLGLGLSISHTIAEAHRGRIWLDETGSSGTVFCLSMPKTERATADVPLPG